MNLLRILYLFVFFTYAPAAPSPSPHVLDTSENDIPLPQRALSPRVPPKNPRLITNQPTTSHAKGGNCSITFLTTTAILPIVSAALPLADFYQQAHLGILDAIASGLRINTYTFAFGALTLTVDTWDGGPIDWQMMIAFTGQMVGFADRGWADFYVALVRDGLGGGLTAVTFGAAGTASKCFNGGTSAVQYKNEPFGS